MTSYEASAAEGRASARERTMGRRKVAAVRIEVLDVPFREWVPAQPPFTPRGFFRDHPTERAARYQLVGECGHILAQSHALPPGWTQAVEHRRRRTCMDDDCRIEQAAEPPDDERCEYVIGVEVERRCSTRARFDTSMGRVCRKHRDHYLREGYLDDEGTPL